MRSGPTRKAELTELRTAAQSFGSRIGLRDTEHQASFINSLGVLSLKPTPQGRYRWYCHLSATTSQRRSTSLLSREIFLCAIVTFPTTEIRGVLPTTSSEHHTGLVVWLLQLTQRACAAWRCSMRIEAGQAPIPPISTCRKLLRAAMRVEMDPVCCNERVHPNGNVEC